MPTTKISRRVLSFCFCTVLFLILLVLVGCSKSSVTFKEAKVLSEDLEEAPFPPTTKDLLPIENSIVVALVKADASLPKVNQQVVIAYIESLFREVGHMQVLPDYRVQSALKQLEKYQDSKDPAEETLRIGRAVKSKYTVFVHLQTPQSGQVPEQYNTQVTFSIYQVSSAKLILQEEFDFSHARSKVIWRDLKRPIQTYFPLQGYILELRNNREFAKVNLGLSQGVLPLREISIFRRVIKNETLKNGAVKQSVSYNLIGNMQVTHVFEREAWATVPAVYRKDIRKGDAAFLKPE